VNAKRCREKKSGNVEISQTIKILVQDTNGDPQSEVDYEIYEPDGSVIEGASDSEGKINHEDLVPGIYGIMIKEEEEENE
jgi:uncharacterized protein (DUF2345 family)